MIYQLNITFPDININEIIWLSFQKEKIAKITHSKLKEDFGNELENKLGNFSE